MKVAVGRAVFSFLQRKGKDLDRRGEEKSPANLKKPPLSNGPDTTSFISALAPLGGHRVRQGSRQSACKKASRAPKGRPVSARGKL